MCAILFRFGHLFDKLHICKLDFAALGGWFEIFNNIQTKMQHRNTLFPKALMKLLYFQLLSLVSIFMCV